MSPRPAPRAALALAGLAIAIGVVDGLVFLGFEWVVKHGTDWIWNDLTDSDTVRWRVVPLALVLSIAFSAVLRLVREARWTEPHLDPLHSAEGLQDEAPPPTLGALGVILLVGASSLLAGAALGPEAPLVAAAVGLGTWAAARADAGPAGRVLILASAGALLAAFFGSLLPLVIPVLVLIQRTKRVAPVAIALIVLAGLAALGTLHLIQGDEEGFGEIPSAGAVDARDYLGAVLLGVLAVPVGMLLRWVVLRLAAVTECIQQRWSWWLAAAAFGAVLGLLYLVGGQSVQFSGSEGIGILTSREGEYGAWALGGIALMKVLVTSWSLAAGYRGGLVFPSVFIGVAVSLCVAAALMDVAGPGVLVGSVAGLLIEMTSPLIGAVMLLSLLPAKLLPLGVAGVTGAIIGRFAVGRLSHPAAPSRMS